MTIRKSLLTKPATLVRDGNGSLFGGGGEFGGWLDRGDILRVLFPLTVRLELLLLLPFILSYCTLFDNNKLLIYAVFIFYLKSRIAWF